MLIILIGIILRLWELDGRMLHYDEAIHLHYGWQLAQKLNFNHSPWMHGPFQIELVAFFIKFIGDNTFIARLPYAFFGVMLIGLPYFIKNQIGNRTAIITSTLIIFSPILSYFSRFGRNDIIIVTLMLLLLIIFWKYIETNKNKYLYIMAALVAILLSTKETSYFVIFFIGMVAFIYGSRHAWLELNTSNIKKFWRLEKKPEFKLKKLQHNKSIGFFVLLAAIVLPQAAAALSIPFQWFGIELAMNDNLSGSTGMTGFPQISKYNFNLGYLSTQLDLYIYPALILLVIVGYIIFCNRKSREINYMLCVSFVSIICILWIVFGNGINILTNIIPNNFASENSIDYNYGIAIFILLILLSVGSIVGSFWHKRVWLISFIIFYSIWISLYTTLFTNMLGIFTGSWQSLGYWFAQQEVARGSQPWYYYIVGLSVYEFLSFSFGFIGILILFKRKEPFGIIIALWALCSFLVYTLASERMPWLMVNIIVPFIICASVFINHILNKIDWKDISIKSLTSCILVITCVALFLWILWLNDKPREQVGFIAYWLFGLICIPLLLCTVYLFYKNIKYLNHLIISIMVVLFIVSTAGMLRSSYIYDDRYKEMLVYAQGSYNLKTDYYKYIYDSDQWYVDTELWYPLQWYTRKDNNIQYIKFCQTCKYNDLNNTDVYLVHQNHIFENTENIIDINQTRRNLLWYPEVYRRVLLGDTNRSFLGDIKFLLTSLIQEETRYKILKYFILREQETDWFRSEYSIYIKKH